MKEKKILFAGLFLIAMFCIWTWLIQIVNVQPAGESGTNVGFATLNCRFHELTGVHMNLYVITDWLGLVPLFICFGFAGLGLVQLIRRKNLLRVDPDILLLGVYYIIVILGYLIFEMIPLNYRPILINGHPEASYPSSTTLLVLCVMPTLIFQLKRRSKKGRVNSLICAAAMLFSLFMVIGRTISGVHWLTDIIGSILFSTGLFLIYKAIVLHWDNSTAPEV